MLPRVLADPTNPLWEGRAMRERLWLADLAMGARWKRDAHGTPRAHFEASNRFLATRWGVSPSTVHTFLRWLESELLIRVHQREGLTVPQVIELTLYEAWAPNDVPRLKPPERTPNRTQGTPATLDNPGDRRTPGRTRTPDWLPAGDFDAQRSALAERQAERQAERGEARQLAESAESPNAGPNGFPNEEKQKHLGEGGGPPPRDAAQKKRRKPRVEVPCSKCGTGVAKDRPDLRALRICETCSRYERNPAGERERAASGASAPPTAHE